MTAHQTNIQWTHVPGYVGATWNPTTGCTRVSPGCDHCYAFQLHDQRYVAKRAGKAVSGAQYDVPFSTVQVLEERIEEPLRARTPRAYFVDSMADLFHEDVPDIVLTQIFDVMERSPHHIFMVLTKRPERMRQFVLARRQRDEDYAEAFKRTPTEAMQNSPAAKAARKWADDPHAHIWLGVSVEDQQRADERVPVLLDTPAAVRFLSCEPLLGLVDLTRVTPSWATPIVDATEEIDWVIVGGESGPHARPFDVSWARSLVEQCRAAGVAPFVKQLGKYPRMALDDWKPSAELAGHPDHTNLRLKHAHGADMNEWPADLRVREWPGIGSAVAS